MIRVGVIGETEATRRALTTALAHSSIQSSACPPAVVERTVAALRARPYVDVGAALDQLVPGRRLLVSYCMSPKSTDALLPLVPAGGTWLQLAPCSIDEARSLIWRAVREGVRVIHAPLDPHPASHAYEVPVREAVVYASGSSPREPWVEALSALTDHQTWADPPPAPSGPPVVLQPRRGAHHTVLEEA